MNNFKKLLTKCGQNVDEKQEKPVLLKTKYRFKNIRSKEVVY